MYTGNFFFFVFVYMQDNVYANVILLNTYNIGEECSRDVDLCKTNCRKNRNYETCVRISCVYCAEYNIDILRYIWFANFQRCFIYIIVFSFFFFFYDSALREIEHAVFCKQSRYKDSTEHIIRPVYAHYAFYMYIPIYMRDYTAST